MVTLLPRTIILLIPSNKLLQPRLQIRHQFIPKLSSLCKSVVGLYPNLAPFAPN
ncbi:hypothetical protein Hanom_Chr04g00285041 [Helianthus anomalus]